MKTEVKEHVSRHSALYALAVILSGTGGAAALTDSLPVLAGDYRKHIEQFEASSDQIKEIDGSLKSIVLSQLRTDLRRAYADLCSATDQSVKEYIQREIDDLEDKYQQATGRDFDRPPCVASQ